MTPKLIDSTDKALRAIAARRIMHEVLDAYAVHQEENPEPKYLSFGNLSREEILKRFAETLAILVEYDKKG